MMTQAFVLSAAGPLLGTIALAGASSALVFTLLSVRSLMRIKNSHAEQVAAMEAYYDARAKCLLDAGFHAGLSIGHLGGDPDDQWDLSVNPIAPTDDHPAGGFEIEVRNQTRPAPPHVH